MAEIKTKYGIITEAERVEYYQSGAVKSIITSEMTTLQTQYGELVPAYNLGDVRKKYRDTLEFYESGNLKSIYLEDQTEIQTPIGQIRVEHVTFYENGMIHRIFPLYGKIDGYWTEENEYELAEEIRISLLQQELVCKPLCIHFYPSGALRSITTWNKTFLEIATKYGTIKTRVGVELYESGKLWSLEPAYGTRIDTKWGTLYPFDSEAFMMHADNNSLKFDEDGEIVSVKTIRNQVRMIKDGKLIAQYVPREEADAMDYEVMVKKPMTIEWTEEGIVIQRSPKEKDFWKMTDAQVEFVENL